MTVRELILIFLRRSGAHALIRRVTGPAQEWRYVRHGRTGPAPHSMKIRTVRETALSHGLDVLVETGTYRGDMVAAQLGTFRRIVTIELSRDLHRQARSRFAKQGHVETLQGDSGLRIAEVLESIDRPALFWLDAHWSGGVTARAELDTPIGAELSAILDHPVKGHVVLIDDAREFDGCASYPTLKALSATVSARRPGSRIEVIDDIVHIALS